MTKMGGNHSGKNGWNWNWNWIFTLGVSLTTDLVPIVQVSVEFSFENSVDVPLWQRRSCTVVIRIL